jgi:DNA (cytosine-5)-methyltransferase 1
VTDEKPRLLDLFCGAGGCTKGYQQAGFYVVGVDIRPQPNYCGDAFREGDALAALRSSDLSSFDAIHASLPCQAYTTMNNRHGSSSPPLIADVRRILIATGLPYVIENVPGARAELRQPSRITGEMCGLRVHRARLFETNWPLMVPGPIERQRDPVAVYGKNDQRRLWTRRDGSELRAATLETGSNGMEIDWMSWNELREAVPPAYTELIGHQLMQHVSGRGAVGVTGLLVHEREPETAA